jgi:hypothetical protein
MYGDHKKASSAPVLEAFRQRRVTSSAKGSCCDLLIFNQRVVRVAGVSEFGSYTDTVRTRNKNYRTISSAIVKTS